MGPDFCRGRPDTVAVMAQTASEKKRAWAAKNPEKYREQRKRQKRQWYYRRKNAEILRRFLAGEPLVRPPGRPGPLPTKDPRKVTLERLVSRAKVRARKAGLPATIGVRDVEIPTACPILGITLDWTGKDRWSTPSLDRVVPSLGYVPGNVVVVSFRANTIKSMGNAEEHEAVARFLRSRGA